MSSKSILNIAVALVLISLMVGMSGCGAELAGKAGSGALVGTWELTTESERGTRTRELVINDDLSGIYKSRNREFPVTDLTVEDDQVRFNLDMSFGERDFVLEFAGTLEGDSLNGKFTNPRGSRKVTGKRAE